MSTKSDDAESVCQVQRPLKFLILKIQDGGRPLRSRDPFCVIGSNFVEIGHTVAEISQFSRFAGET